MKYFATQFLMICYCFLGFSQNRTLNVGWQYSSNTVQWQTVNIPHTWNTQDAFDDTPSYRQGLGYYKKQLCIPLEEKNRVQYLKFNAINQEATVYVNGKKAAQHQGGYTAFTVDITSFLHYGACNLIEVTVDNSLNKNIPPLDADFTFYGGIYRDVEWISVPQQHFSLSDYASEGFYVNYDQISEEKASVSVESILRNSARNSANLKLKAVLFDAQDKEVATKETVLVLKDRKSEKYTIKLPLVHNPKLWSPNSPYLYELQLILTTQNGAILEKKTTSVGFRWATLDSKKGFFLNGKPLKLVGVNRHQDYEGYGNAVPMALQEKDIHLIKNMGTNIIRFAHYPQARELYKKCDELGILVWTEIPIVNKVTNSQAFFETSLTMQKEHIKQYYNHPSVIMFGYMNEIFLRLAFDKKTSKEEKENQIKTTLQLANQLENLTRSLAPNHLTAMACHLNEIYNETGIADLPMVLGWNLYFGWYDAEIEDLGIFLDNQHRSYPNRSLLLSEYGPGADVRIFTRTPKKFDFSTNYQSKLHQLYYKQITERPYMLGMTAWNFADFGSEFRGDAIPHVNQKGLVQYNRKPKEIYYWYQAVLKKEKLFIHIASNFVKDLFLLNEATFPIEFYSNQKNITLFLNDESLGNFTTQNGVIQVDVPFKNGENILRAESGTISEEKKLNVLKSKTIDFNHFNLFGINVGSHFYFYDEENNITFIPDQPYQKATYGYLNGKPLGMSKDKNQGIPFNIKGTHSEPLFQTMLEGCTEYKVNVPNGMYKVTLFFVEPQKKSVENVYNLSSQSRSVTVDNERVFSVNVNEIQLRKNLNLSAEFPEKWGVTLSTEVNVTDNSGLQISFIPKQGKTVLSGILIKKLDV